jgi:DNA-binding CsgD family transcriptional regulator
VLAAARGDGSAAVVALEDALQRHQQVEQPVELARTWLALGTVHRRFKRRSAATDAIGRALEIFTELGMPIWAARAHALMGRTAARTSGPGGLTPTERQIALLVAEGKTNREIAEQAFCSVKTVEAHLTRIYSKLEVRSRTELARSVLSR